MNGVSAPGAQSIDRLQVLFQSHSITASKCISKLARSQAPSVSPNSLDYGLQVHTITASKCIPEFTWSWPPSASLSSLDLGLQVHLQTRSVTASKCISKLARSQPPSVSPNLLNYGLQVHLSTRSITASKYIVNGRRCVYGDTGVTEVDVHSIVIFRRTSNCWQSPCAASPDIPCVDR